MEKILAHYADDFEFTSPFIIHIANEASGQLRGKAAMRSYWEKAMAKRPKLHFTATSVLWGVRSVVINYSREDGNSASEWFELGADGKVVRSAAHYAD